MAAHVDARSRLYQCGADLAPLLAFASRSFAERFPLNANWHPGDVVWELQGAYDQRQPIRMWSASGAVVAAGWFVGPGQLWLETLPASEALVPEIVAWAEAAVRKPPRPGGVTSLSIRAYERDSRRTEALARLGYWRSAPEAVCFRMDLTAPLPVFEPLAGFSTRDCVGVDPEPRAAAHRDAWDHLGHIGLDAARSSFDTERYVGLLTAPVYDPGLDILAVGPDGVFVANCIGWADATSGIGLFEPVGTHVGFRGRGLARLVILEGCRRLKAMGHAWARVGTAHFNAPAISAYRSCGF